MKFLHRLLGIAVPVLMICTASNSQPVALPLENKFKFGDNPEWAKPDFNDKDWTTGQLGKSFKKDSSYAWYRIRIVIPSAMKTTTGKGIKLWLGKIDDVDQTYFNGKLVGETGSFPPQYLTQWDKQRVYVIPEKDVQWDKENMIAVRIYNLVGGMGMWEGPYGFEPLGWIDDVTVKQDFVETANNGFLPKFTLKNKTGSAFSGSINYWIANKANNKILLSEEKPVQLAAIPGAEAEVTFSDFRSETENVFKVGYRINDKNSSLFLMKDQVFVVAANLKIPDGGEVKPLVEDLVPAAFHSIPFRDQSYTGYMNGRFMQNLEQRLLKVDEFGLMGSYMHRPGIHPWAGEHVGKYLETACNVWKLTHNPDLKKQMDRMMYTLVNTQLEDGYLGTYTPDQYWTSWDVWSHKYNLHGLLAYYATTGYKPALEACRKMGDLLCRTFGKKTGQRDIILAGEHIGMAATSVLDAMVALYRFTADKKYLDFCYYILDAWEQENGPHLISAILRTGKVTDVGNGKAYEMLSNYVGLIELYQLTGEERFLKATLAAWQDVVSNRLYITGTTSSFEHFQKEAYLPATAKDNMGEGCVTTTWLQLNQHLFSVTGDVKYLNELEKSVYNHLLAAENPQTGCVSYYTPLMNKKPYTCYITCCQSSVPRGIALVPNFTFGKIREVPTVLFYESAVYKERIGVAGKDSVDLALALEGDFPQSGNLVLTVTSSRQANFPIAFRVPEWCANYTAKIGKKEYKGTANGFVKISRNWASGDRVVIHFGMPVKYISGGKTYPDQIAFQRGPQILAWDKSLNRGEVNDFISNVKLPIQLDSPALENATIPLPQGWIGKQAYSLSLAGREEKLILVPFAEASQTEGDMRVWLPLTIKK